MPGAADGRGPDTGASDSRAGRAAVIGALVGFVVATPAFALLAYAVGAGGVGAVAIGLFVGVWGGCGWGGMMAASVSLSRAEERANGRSGRDKRTAA